MAAAEPGHDEAPPPAGTKPESGGIVVGTISGVTILDEMSRWAELIRAENVPARLECGEAVLNALREQCTYPRTPRPGEPDASLYGIPVVLRDDMEPNAWLLLDRDGQVMKAGVVGIAWERDLIDMGMVGIMQRSRPGPARIVW